MGKTRILIAGIGGVGGYFGGMLAKAYENNNEIEICFLARGEHLKEINNHGLKVIHLDKEMVAHPSVASHDPSVIGKVDYLIMATKSYDVVATAKALLPSIDKKTRILTLLNGVDSFGVLKTIFPENEILNGCVYILSKIKSPGVIENFGTVQKLSFGLDTDEVDYLKPLEIIFRNAGIDVRLSNSISEITWAKFIFISAVATATSFYNEELGVILLDTEKRNTLENLIREVEMVGRSKNIVIAPDILEKVMSKLKSLPFSTTSSMQRDFSQNKTSETHSLTQYVIDEAQKLGLKTPTYQQLYMALKSR